MENSIINEAFETIYRDYSFEVINARGDRSTHTVTSASMAEAEEDIADLLLDDEEVMSFLGSEPAKD